MYIWYFTKNILDIDINLTTFWNYKKQTIAHFGLRKAKKCNNNGMSNYCIKKSLENEWVLIE